MKLTYNPQVFDESDFEAAKRIILTPSQGRDTEIRWERETPYVASLLRDQLSVGGEHLVLDYGCGVGRLSKALIELTGCRVLGADISAKMRAHAPSYVASAKFSAISRAMLDALAHQGAKVDAAFSVWTLQHCRNPADDIALLARVLRPGGRLAVLNSNYRWVPTVEKGWRQDSRDIREELHVSFAHEGDIPLDADALGPDVAEKCFFATFLRKE